MKGRWKQIILGALGLGVVVLTFAVVLPRIASYSDVWAVVKELAVLSTHTPQGAWGASSITLWNS